MKYLFKITALFSIFMASQVNANPNVNYVVSGKSNVTAIYAYSRSTAPGDVFIKISTPSPNCSDGYYILSSSPNKQEILDILVTAYHANIQVILNGFEDPNWRGSSTTNVCEIEGVLLSK